MTADLQKKMWFFGLFTCLQILQPKEWIITFYVYWYHIMMISATLRAFEKIKNIEVFDDCGHAEKCRFWTFHTFADFQAKWENYYIFWCRIMMVSCHFKGFSKNQKNWNFSVTADLQKNVIFGLFTCLQILQPNDWIVTFLVSWCHIMMISCHFKGFWEIQKIEVFDDHVAAERCGYWTFQNFADFVAEWVNCYILGHIMLHLISYYDDFLPF